MPCEGCIQKILAAHEQENNTYKEALALANKTGEWVAIYKDEFGNVCYRLASQAAGLPVTRHVTPELQNTPAKLFH